MWVLLLVVLTLVSGEVNVKEENGVAVLTKDNFKPVLEKHTYVLVEFYAPWCGHCKALKPEYEKAASQVKTDLPDVLLAMVDATVETELASEHGVSGYPTLKFHKNGTWIDYNGDRKAESIVSWLKRKTGPALAELKTVVDCEKFLGSNEVTVLLFTKDEASDVRSVLDRVANAIDGIPFGVTSAKELFEKYGITKDVQVVLFKSFDDRRADYKGDLVFDEVEKFVKHESIPLVVEFSQDSAGAVFGSSVRLHVVAFAPGSSNYAETKAHMTESAVEFKGKAHFIIIDTDQEQHQRILDFFGMTKVDVPGYRMINLTEDMTKFKPDSSDFSKQAMSTFVGEVLNGKRKPFLMSQPVPNESTEPVKVLVGENYNAVTQDQSKTVFVKLYAPWCGHCQQLAPIWESLGAAFKDRDDVVIAKLDATANEAEGLRVPSFPTLKLYPKASSEAVDYSGERTLEALKKFVESEGKVMDTEPSSEKKDEL